MEGKKKIVLILLILVFVMFILYPLLEQFSCDEPKQSFASFIVQKITGREMQQVCPTRLGILKKILKDVLLFMSGLVTGYIGGKPQKEQKNHGSRRIQRCRSLNVGRWDASDEFLEIDLHESQIIKRDIF